MCSGERWGAKCRRCDCRLIFRFNGFGRIALPVAQDACQCANFGIDRQQRVVLCRPHPIRRPMGIGSISETFTGGIDAGHHSTPLDDRRDGRSRRSIRLVVLCLTLYFLMLANIVPPSAVRAFPRHPTQSDDCSPPCRIDHGDQFPPIRWPFSDGAGKLLPDPCASHWWGSINLASPPCASRQPYVRGLLDDTKEGDCARTRRMIRPRFLVSFGAHDALHRPD
jgi:hypothetical protein